MSPAPPDRTDPGGPDPGDPDPDPDYRWMSAVAAAELLGVSERRLMRLIDRGDVPAYVIDGELRLRRHEVVRVREQHRWRDGRGS